eukprot:PITA_02552
MVDDQPPNDHLFAISVLSPWFVDIANYFVAAEFPPNLSSNEKSRIIRKSAPFTWIGGDLFKLGPNQTLRRCVKEEEVFDFFWYVMMGLVEAVKIATEEKVVEFLRDNAFYKFDYPRGLVTNQGAQFTSHLIENMLSQHKIKHRKSTAYGQVEVTNKALERILTKITSKSRKYCTNRLVEATGAYNTTWKTIVAFTHYDLVYGKKALLSIEFEYDTLRMAAQLDLDITKTQQERLLQLNGLDEFRVQALLHTDGTQVQKKVWHDKNIKDRVFQEGDWALPYNSRFKDFKGKLMTRWLGPHLIIP